MSEQKDSLVVGAAKLMDAVCRIGLDPWGRGAASVPEGPLGRCYVQHVLPPKTTAEQFIRY